MSGKGGRDERRSSSSSSSRNSNLVPLSVFVLWLVRERKGGREGEFERQKESECEKGGVAQAT